jgi:hypothetical protein
VWCGQQTQIGIGTFATALVFGFRFYCHSAFPRCWLFWQFLIQVICDNHDERQPANLCCIECADCILVSIRSAKISCSDKVESGRKFEESGSSAVGGA